MLYKHTHLINRNEIIVCNCRGKTQSKVSKFIIHVVQLCCYTFYEQKLLNKACVDISKSFPTLPNHPFATSHLQNTLLMSTLNYTIGSVQVQQRIRNKLTKSIFIMFFVQRRKSPPKEYKKVNMTKKLILLI